MAATPDDRTYWTKRAIVLLAAMLQTVESIDEVGWPIGPDTIRPELRSDAFNLAELIRDAGWSREDYNKVLLAALKVTISPAYLQLQRLIVGSLDYWPVLDRSRLRLLAEARAR